MAEAWDYIIVGGGSAGATVAARLSEDPDAKVLLLEAGPDYRSSETPDEFLGAGRGGLTEELPADDAPGFVWTDITCRRNPTQEAMPYRRGRGLGGCSTINGLCAIRGVPDDFTRWTETGIKGWRYEDILWAYKKLETDPEYGDAPYHGSDGPTPIYRAPESDWGGADRALREAALDVGYPWMDDTNAPHTTGLGRFAMNVRDGGRRVSTNDAYLEPARDRENLDILGDAHVDRVLLSNGRATGVRLADGQTVGLSAGGEVVISAGAVHSPAILMRSGIGPAPLLSSLGIEVMSDLPVGKGIQDHAMLFEELPVGSAAAENMGNPRTNVILRYSSGLGGAGSNDMALLATFRNYWFGRPTGGMAIILNQAFSRGELTIASSDPYRSPHIEANLCTDERDIVRMEDALERSRELLQHPAFAHVAAGKPVVPATREAIHRQVRDVMHVSSGVRMGREDDPEAVLDSDCRVFGIEGLRTVDASVMPDVVCGNLHLTIIAIAELVAARMRGQSPEAVAVGLEATAGS